MKNAYIESILEEVYLCEGSTWRVRDIRNLNESTQKDVANKTITTLFRDIKAKAFNLDFSDVEVGKGDITKINGYKDLLNAINFLKKLSMNIKNPDIIKAITEIESAHQHLVAHKAEFTMGFRLGNNLIIYLFNSVAVGLIQATAYIVSEGVEVVKDNMNTYHCELKDGRKLPKNANLSALVRFNQMAKNGKLKTALNNTLKLKESVNLHKVISISLGSIGAVLGALWLIRELVFHYYYVRIALSAYLKQLKEFVLMNASTLSADQKNTRERQEKMAKKLGELADKIAVDQDMATERSKQGIAQSNRSASTTNTPENSGELADILY